jgi:hypothetical protein
LNRKIEYTEGATVLIASDIGKTIANGTATGTILTTIRHHSKGDVDRNHAPLPMIGQLPRV